MKYAGRQSYGGHRGAGGDLTQVIEERRQTLNAIWYQGPAGAADALCVPVFTARVLNTAREFDRVELVAPLPRDRPPNDP